MSVRRRGNRWVVTDRSGNKVLGTHKTRSAAAAQLRAIEANKKRRGK